jgi:hypothetical protein
VLQLSVLHDFEHTKEIQLVANSESERGVYLNGGRVAHGRDSVHSTHFNIILRALAAD